MNWFKAERHPNKTLWIHAGPHKTASTYIIRNLRKNRTSLRKSGILISKDNIEDSHHLIHKNWDYFDQQLKSIPKNIDHYLLSRETLHTRIVKPSFFDPLIKIASCHGFQLGLIFVLRDQADWINSMFAHRIRCFQEKGSFNHYRKSIQKRDRFSGVNYTAKFEAITNHPDIQTVFIPLSSRAAITDPFLALVSALNPEIAPDHWSLIDAGESNIQPGNKAIWLSEICRNILVNHNIDLKNLKGKAQAIRNIAIEHEWQQERYYAFTPSQYQKTRNFYAKSNALFAKKHWDCDWQSLFPDRELTKRSIYKGPHSKQERQLMLTVLLRALTDMNLPEVYRPIVRKAFREECRHLT